LKPSHLPPQTRDFISLCPVRSVLVDHFTTPMSPGPPLLAAADIVGSGVSPSFHGGNDGQRNAR
jgi:hypothetical protein